MVLTAPLFFSGAVDIGAVFQAGSSFGRVLGALSVFVAQFQLMAELSASAHRLATFNEILDKQHSPACDDGVECEIERKLASGLSVQDLTVLTPDRKHQLVSGVHFDMPERGRLIITGPTGVGKSSLLRAIAGLWTAGSGQVALPAPQDVLFLPQKPYMPLGSFREQLTYPGRGDAPTDEQLFALIDQVNLRALVTRLGGLDVIKPWSEQLSGGEQQLVAFARMLLAKPKLAILDEATSALDSANEAHLYELITASGIAVVSVAHRTQLIQHHDHVLELRQGGGWTFSKTDP